MTEVSSTKLAGMTFATFFQRLLISFLDYLVFFVFNWFLFPLFLYASFKYKVILPLLLYHLGWVSFVTWLLVRFGGTPACLLLRFRVYDLLKKKLTMKRAILRNFPFLISSFLYLNLLHQFLLNLPQNVQFIDISGIVELMMLHSGWLFAAYRIASFFYILDLGFILYNHHSRSITDMVAGSVVVFDD